MLKTLTSNFILSKINVDKAKRVMGHTPILNIFYKIGSQYLIDHRYPTHLFIETTRACNLSCKPCPRSINSFQYGHMDYKLFKKIIDEANGFGSRNFCLHMLGEPLLHPRITEFVQYIKALRSRHSILLTTNGYFLDAHKVRMFIENGLDKIAVSFFSLKPDRLKSLTGNPDIQRVVDNLSAAVKLNRQMHGRTKISIRFLLDDNNLDELDDFYALTKKVGAVLEVRSTHNYSGVIENNCTARLVRQKRYPCYHLWFSPAVTWDGKAVLCCNDWNYSEIIGDVNNQLLADIWQGKRLQELRRFHLEGCYNKIPLCQKCNVWTLYPDVFFNSQKKG